ncbi:hypothetical protein ACXZ1M_13410 [Duganella sp. PWIR1]
MLTLELDWLAAVSLLRSDRWLEFYMQPERTLQSLEPSKLAVAALMDLQYYQSDGIRIEDAKSALEPCLADQLDNSSSLDFLTAIANQLLDFSEITGRVTVKDECLELWTALIAKVDPVWFIAARLAEQLSNQAEPANMVEQLESVEQCANAFGISEAGLKYADNHLHISGMGGPALALLDFAVSLGSSFRKGDTWPHQPEFTLYGSGKRDLDELPRLLNNLFYFLANDIFGIKAQLRFPRWQAPSLWVPVKQSIHRSMDTGIKDTICQHLLHIVFDQAAAPQRRWLMLATALLLHDRMASPQNVRHFALRAFMHASNVFRSSMISAGTGLGSFLEHFRFVSRKGRDNEAYRKFSVIHNAATNVSCEFKVGKVDIEISKLASSAGLLIQSGRADNAHFVYHFTRETGNRAAGDRLYAGKRHSAKAVAENILKTLLSSKARKHILSLPSSSVSVTLDLALLLRGIDVAGDENGLPIEVFAPAIRYLRHEWINKTPVPLIDCSSMQPLHLSIHAGEDFSHIASGMRAIDETVEFCAYGDGDRLGHALALGIDVRQWIARQRKIYISLQEHLDNLVWCHSRAMTWIPPGHPGRQAAIEILEQKIAGWSEKLYGAVQTPAVLHTAWTLRKNCPLKAKDPVAARAPMQKPWVPDADYLANNRKSIEVKLWRQYIDPLQLQHRERQIRLYTSDSLLPSLEVVGNDTEVISEPEIELLTMLQDAMMESLAEKKIAIEACPTSNVYTGRLRNHQEHPIFRWDPPDSRELVAGTGMANIHSLRTQPLRVCINTDDPGLMPTTIAHEYKLIESAAQRLYHAVPAQNNNVQTWITRILSNGQEIFDGRHRRWQIQKLNP